MDCECRVVTSGLLGIDGAGTLVRIKPGAMLYVMSETAPDGFIQVNCVLCAKHLRVFAADLLDRTTSAAATGERGSRANSERQAAVGQ
jgi:hypothetical protein